MAETLESCRAATRPKAVNATRTEQGSRVEDRMGQLCHMVEGMAVQLQQNRRDNADYEYTGSRRTVGLPDERHKQGNRGNVRNFQYRTNNNSYNNRGNGGYSRERSQHPHYQPTESSGNFSHAGGSDHNSYQDLLRSRTVASQVFCDCCCRAHLLYYLHLDPIAYASYFKILYTVQ